MALPALVLGLLPLVAARPLTPSRGVTSVFFVSLAVLLSSWPWSQRVTLTRGGIRKGWRTRPAAEALAIQLGEADRRGVATPYRAWVEFEDSHWLVGAAADPSHVIERSMSLAEALRIPVRAGWGISSSAVDSLGTSSRPSPTPFVAAPRDGAAAGRWSWTEQPQQRQSALVFLVLLAGVGSLLGFFVLKRLRYQQPVSLWSIALDVALLSLFAGLALAVRRPRWSAEMVGQSLQVVHVPSMGRKREYGVRLEEIRFAERVSGGDFVHLIVLGRGLVALPLSGAESEAFCSALLERIAKGAP